MCGREQRLGVTEGSVEGGEVVGEEDGGVLERGVGREGICCFEVMAQFAERGC